METSGIKTGGVKPTSPLYKLDPYMAEIILRVGGRLSRSTLPYDSRHQMLIPQKSLLAKMVLFDIHKRIGHMGKNAILAELRKCYWIPRAGSLIKSILCKCVTCRKYRASMVTQQMADLPRERLVSDVPPFTNVGMDYFGPITVKRGRVSVKRYGVVFTCLSCRAVHLEVSFSLDTSSCISAIRRFVARRGSVETIWSDNGTNLVGAERELCESIKEWNQSRINETLQQKNIRWVFNPPSASHFGVGMCYLYGAEGSVWCVKRASYPNG